MRARWAFDCVHPAIVMSVSRSARSAATRACRSRGPHSRATRAAMVFGTATMVTAIACGGTVTADSGAAPNPSPTETAAPVYGAPVDASPPPVDASRPPDGSLGDASPPKDAAPYSPIAPAYGAPPPDAAVPAYGAPPPRDGGP